MKPAALVLAVLIGIYLYSTGLFDHLNGSDAADVNGTITALHTYPGHSRTNITATNTDPYREPQIATGTVSWNPTWEACLRYDDGTSGCVYVVFGFNDLHVGQHLGKEPITDGFCAPHPAPSDEAADKFCPAFNADGDRVTPNGGAA